MDSGVPRAILGTEEALLQFFLCVSTRPGHGICFQSTGLMPPDNASLYNPLLAEFILALKTNRRASHQRLLLEILAANAELIAHWTKNVRMNFNPRLHRDWFRAMELLHAVIEIALPKDTFENLPAVPASVLL